MIGATATVSVTEAPDPPSELVEALVELPQPDSAIADAVLRPDPAPRPSRRVFSPEYKLAIVAE